MSDSRDLVSNKKPSSGTNNPSKNSEVFEKDLESRPEASTETSSVPKKVKKPRSRKKLQEEFSCPVCFQVYVNKRFFIKHVKRKHSAKRENIAPEEQKIVLSMKCNVCGEVFDEKSKLENHVRQSHVNVKSIFIWKCNICGKDFADELSLESHIRENHFQGKKERPSEEDILSEVAGLSENESSSENESFSEKRSPSKKKRHSEPFKKHVCSECDKRYSKMAALRKHVKLLHPSKLESIAPFQRMQGVGKIRDFTCDNCGQHYTRNSRFQSHIRRNNCGKKRVVRKGVSCPLCKGSVHKLDFNYHCEVVHNISIETEKLNFATPEDFNLWKGNVEKDTHSRYVKEQSATQLKDGTIKVILRCHRSGVFNSRSEGHRNLKSQGSCKTGYFCPASMVMYNNIDSRECRVVFTKTHLGHDLDIRHIPIPEEQRQMLISKIASRTPFNVILDEMRDSISESGLERMHLLTKKDLHNIKQSLNIDAPIQDKNDIKNVHSWVCEMEKQENSCILFYKPQNIELSQNANLLKEDFVVIIMNDAQCEMLKSFGSDCICVDEIRGADNCEFQLMSISVLDEMRQGFPCTFMISNRSDEHVLKVFFEQINKKCGLISTRVFMSDMSETYYSVWLSVMSPVEMRLFCSWDVDRDWRANLKKIKSLIKQAEVYRLLRSLLEEKDTITFEEMLNNGIQTLSSDPEVADFRFYFLENYVNDGRVYAWAYCFRYSAGITMHIERTHKSLKHIYLQGNNVKRLDKAIKTMMSFVKDKLVYREALLSKENLRNKLMIMTRKHSESLTYQANVVKTEGGWRVHSSTTYESYLVSQNLKDCCCEVICSQCKVCLHKYSCTCTDSSIRWNMCKHIHSVCRFISEEENGQNDVSHDDCHGDEPNVCSEESNGAAEILEQMCRGDFSERQKQPPNCLDEKRKAVKEHILNIIDSCKSIEEVEVFEKFSVQVQSAIEIIRNDIKKS